MVKKIGYIIIAITLTCSVLGFIGYRWIFSCNTNINEPYELYIPHQSSFKALLNQLKIDSVLKDQLAFEQVARLMKYDKEEVPSGRYIIEPGWSNRQIISVLRAGIQSPVRVTVSTGRTIEEIAGIVAKKIEPDSIEILSLLRDSALLAENGFNEASIIGMIIPDTYEMYWNVEAKSFFNKMKKEYDKYWSGSNREALLTELAMTKNEVSTLASIVEKESIQESERPIIAGLYLNRLKRGIPLQADPTVVYGVGDFTIRRVLNRHLQYDSPYNTYLYTGLPPGPICMPSKSSLDAVLKAETHDYLFMCAKPGYNGAHSFATTNAQHERNAAIYRKWLNEQNIMK